MILKRVLPSVLPCAVAACAQYDTGRPFDEWKADDIRIGKTSKREVRELLGSPHTSGLTPMAGMAPGMQTMPIAPMQGVPGPMGGEKDTDYWTYQYTKGGASAMSPFRVGGQGRGVSLQITFKKDVVSDCILTNTETTNKMLFVPYYSSGHSEGTTHQRRCGDKSGGER